MTQVIEQEKVMVGSERVAAPAPTLVIAPSRGWGRLGLHDVWEYRELLVFLL